MKLIKSKGFAIALIILGILFLLFSLYGLLNDTGNGNDGSETASSGQEWTLEEEQTKPDGEEDTGEEATYISIPGFDTATIAADSESVFLYLYNPTGNSCYFVISIYLTGADGEDELIYQSNLVSPGQELYTITLERSLESGSYDAYVNYATYTMDGEYTPLNGANVPFTLIVE